MVGHVQIVVVHMELTPCLWMVLVLVLLFVVELVVVVVLVVVVLTKMKRNMVAPNLEVGQVVVELLKLMVLVHICISVVHMHEVVHFLLHAYI